LPIGGVANLRDTGAAGDAAVKGVKGDETGAIGVRGV
jgi:hypothetical protein